MYLKSYRQPRFQRTQQAPRLVARWSWDLPASNLKPFTFAPSSPVTRCAFTLAICFSVCHTSVLHSFFSLSLIILLVPTLFGRRPTSHSRSAGWSLPSLTKLALPFRQDQRLWPYFHSLNNPPSFKLDQHHSSCLPPDTASGFFGSIESSLPSADSL